MLTRHCAAAAALLLAICASLAAGQAQDVPAGQATQSTPCSLTEGPRAGTIVIVAALPIGHSCDDGHGSSGTVISAGFGTHHNTVHHHVVHHHHRLMHHHHVVHHHMAGGAGGGGSMEQPAPPPPPESPPPPAEGPPPQVAQIRPYYWKPNQTEPPAPFYFYLLFGQASQPSVQLAALRAVICDLHKSPVELPPQIEEDEAPLLLPVVSRFDARVGVQSTERQLVRFRNESYDSARAQSIIHRLGLPSTNVYLLASRRPIRQLPNGAAIASNADYRAVYVDRSDPYEGIALRSIMAEAYDGTLFNGNSSRDVGYAVVSFVYRLGTVVASVVPSANAATVSAARDDQGICTADG